MVSEPQPLSSSKHRGGLHSRFALSCSFSRGLELDAGITHVSAITPAFTGRFFGMFIAALGQHVQEGEIRRKN